MREVQIQLNRSEQKEVRGCFNGEGSTVWARFIKGSSGHLF